MSLAAMAIFNILSPDAKGENLLVYNPPFKAPKQLIATSVLNTTAPNLPIVAFPKSSATVFDEATTDGLRTIK